MLTLYERIEKLCTTFGDTITSMCKNANISRASLSDLKMGRTKSLSADAISKIAEYYNINSGYLLGLEDETFYEPEESRKICEEIARVYQETPQKFNGFFVPAEIKKQIMNGTYQFSTLTFPQFAQYIGKTLEDILNSDKKTPAPEIRDGKGKNLVRTIGRDGSYSERWLTDEQLEALQAIINQMPDVKDDF